MISVGNSTKALPCSPTLVIDDLPVAADMACKTLRKAGVFSLPCKSDDAVSTVHALRACGVLNFSSKQFSNIGVPVINTKVSQPSLASEKFIKKIVSGFRIDAKWSINSYQTDWISFFTPKLRGKKCLIALSGGIDSSVAAALTQHAVGRNLICVYFRTGVNRSRDDNDINTYLVQQLGLNVKVRDISQRVLSALAPLTAGTEKKKAIRKIFNDELQKSFSLEKADHIVNGTILEDSELLIIDSSGSPIRNFDQKSPASIEPLRYLYKDEVRELGRTLKLPNELYQKYPFPSWGYARCIDGPATQKNLEVARLLDETVIDGIIKDKLYEAFSSVTTKITSYASNAQATILVSTKDDMQPAQLQKIFQKYAQLMNQRVPVLETVALEVNSRRFKLFPTLDINMG